MKKQALIINVAMKIKIGITKFVVCCSCDKFFKGLQTYFKIERIGMTVSNHFFAKCGYY